MKLIETYGTDPYENLALEEYVFESLPLDESYFMLWQNSRTIVIGKYQNTAEEINRAYTDAHGIRVARRMSGGGAVYHDEGNLNYTLIMDRPASMADGLDLQLFTKPLVRVLRGYGLRAEFSGRNDVLVDGCKVCGNAQYLKDGRLMHHGCILLDTDLTVLGQALRPREAKVASRSDKSVRSRVTTINEHLERKITMQAFRRDLAAEFMQGTETGRYFLTEADKAAVKRLRDEKYATWEWNYGADLAYELRAERKFAAGLVTVCMNADRGRIREIRFQGDFFGSGEIGELERGLQGVRLDQELERRLRELRSETFISGVSASELAALICG